MDAAAENGATALSRPRPRLSAAEHRRLRRRYDRHRTLTAYGFLAPNLVFFTLFLLLPVMWLGWLTFHTGGVLEPVRFVGLRNWAQVFDDALVLKTIGNTLLYCLMAIPSVFILAMILALCLKNVRHGTVTIRAVLYLPTLQPVLTAALMWTFVVHPDFGALNLIARAVSGAPVNFLGSTSLALPTIAMVEVWRGLGFWTLLFFAGLLAMPRDLFYAASLDGAGALRRFVDLTLPLLRPTFYFAVVFCTQVNQQLLD
jgi:ABC-type sugar transport system permease subunit